MFNKSKPLWLILPEETVFQTLVSGIENSCNCGYSAAGLQESPNSAFVDYSIADIVIALNKCGAKTLFSCSGICFDHKRQTSFIKQIHKPVYIKLVY